MITFRTKHSQLAWQFFLLILIFYLVSPLLGHNIFLSQDELILNYWSWRCGLGPYPILPIGNHDDRPIGWFVINLMYELFGPNHQLQLITILIIHWFNSLFIFHLAKKLLKFNFIAILCAIIFACLYPANSTILYIGAIFDLMCVFFVLLSLNFFIHSRSPIGKVFSILCYYAALRAKEMAFALPIILALYYWAINKLEISLKTLTKIAKQTWPFFLILTLVLIVYFRVGRLGGGSLSNSHPYFMDLSMKTGYRLFNHYVSRLSWIPVRFHPGSMVIISLIASITLSSRILTASIISLALSLAPVSFYPNHIFDLYLYLPNVFFSTMIGSIIKIIYEYCVNHTSVRRKNIVEMVLPITISIIVVCITIITTSSNEFQEKMRIECATRQPLDSLAVALLSKQITASDDTTFYIAGLPYVSINQGPNWPEITHLIRLVYKNDTLNVVTDNMSPDIEKEYNNDLGTKSFLLWRNGNFVMKNSK